MLFRYWLAVFTPDTDIVAVTYKPDVLFRLGGLPPSLLGAGGVVLYCGAYTPLKQRNKWALFVGAFAGAIPPVTGCIAAGETLIPKMLAIGLFMYFWQIPHFIMVLLKYRQDYLLAGLPLVLIDSSRLKLLAAAGTGATAMSTILFPTFGLVDNTAAITILLPCGIAIVISFILLSRTAAGQYAPGHGRMALYTYQACILATLIFSALSTPK